MNLVPWLSLFSCQRYRKTRDIPLFLPTASEESRGRTLVRRDDGWNRMGGTEDQSTACKLVCVSKLGWIERASML